MAKTRKKKKSLLKLMKKHKAASAVIIIFLVLLLTVGGIIGSILWGLYGDSVGIVDPEDVDPTASQRKTEHSLHRTSGARHLRPAQPGL